MPVIAPPPWLKMKRMSGNFVVVPEVTRLTMVRTVSKGNSRLGATRPGTMLLVQQGEKVGWT